MMMNKIMIKFKRKENMNKFRGVKIEIIVMLTVNKIVNKINNKH